MEYHLKKKTHWQLGDFSICHDVRKNMDGWERRQLLISGLDASFLGKHDGLVDSKAVD